MFKRNKKDNQQEKKLDFKIDNYYIKDSYKSCDLFIAKLEYISSDKTYDAPMVIQTKQKYIFEKVIMDEKVKYIEVFTGFIADTKSDYFDLPYVVEIKSLKEIVPTIADTIHKYGMLLLLEEINNLEKGKVYKK